MVLVSAELNPSACFEFEADICVLYHNKSICRGFQTVVHVGNVRQTAIITKMSKVLICIPASVLPSPFSAHHLPPQPIYGPFSGTTWVSRCHKRTSGLYGARED